MCLIDITSRKPARKGYGLKLIYGPIPFNLVTGVTPGSYSSWIYSSPPYHVIGEWSESHTRQWEFTTYRDLNGKKQRYRPYYHLWLDYSPIDVKNRYGLRPWFGVFEYDGATVEGVEQPFKDTAVTAVVAKRIKLLSVGTYDEAVKKLRKLKESSCA